MARGEPDFLAQCQYVLDNPVRRGLVEVWSEYPWAGTLDSAIEETESGPIT